MARTATLPRRTAADAYEEHRAAIERLLKKLPAALAEHDRTRSSKPGAAMDWGYVGDLAAAEDQLTEALRLLSL